MALDERADDLTEFVEGITFPVLVDRDHLLADLYAVSNVPTVVWIDADDTIARPNSVAFGTDTFADFTGVHAEPHLDAIRHWVRTGDAGATVEVGEAVGDLDDDEIAARLWFRIGAHLHREGDDRAASRLERAIELAPLDFTIHRAALPLLGDDPFGTRFFELYERWEQADRPYHGLPPDPD